MGNSSAIQLADCEKIVRIDERLFATAHFFFNDGDESPVAEVRDGALWFFDEAAMLGREEKLATTIVDDLASHAEKELERQIVAALRKAGRHCRQQVRCMRGVVDIVVDDNEPALIEVKASVEWRDVATAIGQVILYGLSFPSHKLYIALPAPLDEATSTALRNAGVGEWK